MSEWVECKIGDVCSSISDTYKGGAQEVILINTSDVLEGKCLNHQKTPNKNLKGQFKKTFQKDDILYSEIRPANKRYAFIDFDATDYIASTKLMVIRHNEKILPLYLYYILKSRAVIDELQMLAETRSGTFPQITFSELANLNIKLPSSATQKKILDVLKTLDEKIDVNNKIDVNLEQQSQTLFKSWIEKENSNMINLSDIAEFTSGYSYKGDELKPSKTAMATIKNFDRNGGFKIDGLKEVVPSNKLKDGQVANLYDILVAHTDITQNAEVIGNAEMLLSFGGYERIIFSMDLVKVEPKKVFPYKFILAALLRTSAFKNHSLGYVNGTTVLHLSKRALQDYNFFLTSNNEELEKMDRLIGDFYRRQAHIIEQNALLVKLRDTLLPRLMSGELEVKDIEDSL